MVKATIEGLVIPAADAATSVGMLREAVGSAIERVRASGSHPHTLHFGESVAKVIESATREELGDLHADVSKRGARGLRTFLGVPVEWRDRSAAQLVHGSQPRDP